MRYYHLEYQTEHGWITTGILLGGDFHEHMKLMEHLQLEYKVIFRAQRISQQAVDCLCHRGMTLLCKT